MRKSALVMALVMLTTAAVYSNGQPETLNTASQYAVALPKNMTVYVGAKAGGASDIAARVLATYLQSVTGINCAIVNQDSAAAYQSVLSAKPDGTAVTVQHPGIIVSYIAGGIDFDPRESYSVICEYADMGDNALIVPAKAPYSNMDEFVAYCKSHPGEVSAAIATNSTSQLIMGLVSRSADIQLKYVQCATEADKLANVSGGYIGLANCSLKNAKQYEEAGMVKVIGTFGSSTGNNPNYPQWKSLPQQGYDVTLNGRVYFFTPAGIDEGLANTLNLALKGIVDDKKSVETFGALGGGIVWSDLATSRKNFNDAVDLYKLIADDLGMTKIR
ncbi:MAG: tripartite tricarboxylate transporter substrate-binding protein [Spirochaetota bacterium]